MPEFTTRPLFSIITVTYNASRLLEPTMRSVAEQTYSLYEHLIIDGASNDETVEMAESMGTERTRIISEPDEGLYDAMNKGMELAKGDYFIFLNAGDSFHSSDVLRMYANAITTQGYPGIVYGQTDLVDIQRRRLGPRHLKAPENLTLMSFASGMLVCHQAMAVNRKLTSWFNTKFRFSADYDWVIRCLQHSRKNVYIDKVVIDYLHEGLSTRNRRKSLMERFRIMCYYYGTIPTILRHLRFIPRFIIQRQRENAASKTINQMT